MSLPAWREIFSAGKEAKAQSVVPWGSKRFFRRTKHILVGIIGLWQENVTKHGGKIIGYTAFPNG
jgi:hypothetical protein